MLSLIRKKVAEKVFFVNGFKYFLSSKKFGSEKRSSSEACYKTDVSKNMRSFFFNKLIVKCSGYSSTMRIFNALVCERVCVCYAQIIKIPFNLQILLNPKLHNQIPDAPLALTQVKPSSKLHYCLILSESAFENRKWCIFTFEYVSKT